MRSLPTFCQGCGEKLPALGDHAIACPYCGGDLRAVERASSVAPLEGRRTHHATTAALLSLVVPGAGQVFNGHFFRGFLILGTFWLIVPWIFGVIDAWTSARRAEVAHGAPLVL